MDRRVRVLALDSRHGQSTALAAGFAAVRGEITAVLDGDLQNDPADIGRLLEELDKGYDVVSGWRKDRRDRWTRSWSERSKRRWPSIACCSFVTRT